MQGSEALKKVIVENLGKKRRESELARDENRACDAEKGVKQIRSLELTIHEMEGECAGSYDDTSWLLDPRVPRSRTGLTLFTDTADHSTVAQAGTDWTRQGAVLGLAALTKTCLAVAAAGVPPSTTTPTPETGAIGATRSATVLVNYSLQTPSPTVS